MSTHFFNSLTCVKIVFFLSLILILPFTVKITFGGT